MPPAPSELPLVLRPPRQYEDTLAVEATNPEFADVLASICLGQRPRPVTVPRAKVPLILRPVAIRQDPVTVVGAHTPPPSYLVPRLPSQSPRPSASPALQKPR
jgi:hypothetical protein